VGFSNAVGLELKGTVMSLDGVYDSKANRKMIFNHGMTPNLPENKRNRKTTNEIERRQSEGEKECSAHIMLLLK
jgi:hypothetical protein